ncbi:MAG: helix-turn-helix domain-containing protein [Rubrivivax sp.]|nr:helix-turn-helix domain-containing protein [Rubrivivax sp.]
MAAPAGAVFHGRACAPPVEITRLRTPFSLWGDGFSSRDGVGTSSDVPPAGPALSSTSTPLRLDTLKAVCANCNLRELCLPVGLGPEPLEQLDHLIGARRRVLRGEMLYHAGDRFDVLYAVKVGFFKTVQSLENGTEQVTGFQMAGEMMGLDAISSGVHTVEAVALEDSQVCSVPFRELEELARRIPALQSSFHKILSREIVRDHGAMLMMGTLQADQRLAAFLLNLAMRLNKRGWSSTDMLLRMSREEIGSYLGLKLETVSRAFTRLQELGLLAVDKRQVRLVSPDGLRALIGRGERGSS